MKKYRVFLAFAALVATLGTLAPVTTYAGIPPTCQAIFAPPRFGTLRQEFKHNTKYSNELLDQSPIKDQCQLGTCHLNAWASDLERSYKIRKGRTLILSADYLTAIHFAAASEALLFNPNPNAKLDLGSDALASRALLLRYGLMPEGAWHGGVNFEKSPFAERLQVFAQNIVTRAKMANLKELDPVRKLETLLRARADIDTLFTSFIGVDHLDFEFEGKVYNPQTFAREMFPELTRKEVYMQVHQVDNGKTRVLEGAGVTFVDASISQLENTAKTLIDQDKNVFLGFALNSGFVDHSRGIFSIDAIHVQNAARPLSREQMQTFGIMPGGHAVQIVGYDQDPATGRIIKWKIKNSWGNKVGDQGYYHMYEDYFSAFAQMIVFDQSPEIALPKAEVVDPVQLEFQLQAPEKSGQDR